MGFNNTFELVPTNIQPWTAVLYIMLGDCIATSAYEKNTKVVPSSYISKVNELPNAVPSAVIPIWWRMVFARATLSLSIGGKKVILHMKVHRDKCKCTDCDYDCQERLPLAADSLGHTRRFARYVVDRVKQAQESKVLQLMRMAITTMAYRTCAWYDCPVSTGKVEGINNKIKVMKRGAYAFRNERYFHLRIHALHDYRSTPNVGET